MEGLNYTATVYRDQSTGQVHLFAPTVRVKAGDTVRINLSNELLNPNPEFVTTIDNGFTTPFAT